MPSQPPTKGDTRLALKWAHQHADDPDLGSGNAARVLLHATAELARAEERIRLLRPELEHCTAYLHPQGSVYRRVRVALDQDDKLAREAKETTVETTEPNADTTNDKAPERSEHTRSVRVAHFTGQMVPATLPGNPPTFTPKPGERICKCGGALSEHPIPGDGMCDEFEDAEQPMEPPAGEVSDKELSRLFDGAYVSAAHEPTTVGQAISVARRALYDAGRASRDAELLVWLNDTDVTAPAPRDDDHVGIRVHGLMADKELLSAEVAELKRELAQACDDALVSERDAQRLLKERENLRQELEAEIHELLGVGDPPRELPRCAYIGKVAGSPQWGRGSQARTMGGFYGKVLAWRPVPHFEPTSQANVSANPVRPTRTLDDAFAAIEALTRRYGSELAGHAGQLHAAFGRLDELEIQVKVARRWIDDDYPDEWCGGDDEPKSATARIEREERERNK